MMIKDKESQVIMLPTENKNALVWKDAIGNLYPYKPRHVIEKQEFPQHLYFTVDERPVTGDWVIDSFNAIFRIQVQDDTDFSKYRKIVGATDTKLCTKMISHFGDDEKKIIKCLPKSSQAFIEAFCEAGGIWKVLIEYRERQQFESEDDYNYGCGIEIKVNSHNEITIHPIKNSWNKEEVIAFGLKCIQAAREFNSQDGVIDIDQCYDLPRDLSPVIFDPEKWIKQNL